MERYAGLAPLPARIERLPELAVDLWWSWHHEARMVFRMLDYPLWRATAHNPVRMLWMVPRATLERATQDPVWLRLYDQALAKLDDARAARFTWCTERVPDLKGQSIAYFSAEFALHQSLPIYAGGLGVLAGDHCKEASDLGVPLIGVGFMYPQGYFHQHITADGWQEESYEKLNWADTAIEPARTPDGEPAVTAVPLGDRTVLVAVWRVRLGRVTLYLLDTELEENAPWDRSLSARLYGGDRETRVQQEIILGIGGVRALRTLGCHPTVWHLNEGHAGFVVLQRIREFVDQGLSFDDAVEEVRRTTVFTTHTPVPAGHDAFNFQLVEKHLAGAWGSLGTYRVAVPRARRVRQRGRRAVQHDGARAPHGRVGERGQPAARRGHARDVGSDLARRPRRGRARAGAHERRPRADVGLARDGAALLAVSRRGLDRTARRPDDVGRRSSTSLTPSSGPSACCCGITCSPSSGSGPGRSGPTTA